MYIAAPQGPLIPRSTNYLTNFTRILKSGNISGNSFQTPNPATPNNPTTLSEGTLSNLNDPVLDSQGATLAYAKAHGEGGGNPQGPLESVQYNSGGQFQGSSLLTWNSAENTLNASSISNGTITIASDTITGLTNPTLLQEAATKGYVDTYASLTTTTNNTIGSTTYSASSLINGIIYRNNQTPGGTTTDTLPTASQIISLTNAAVGTTIYFGIKNVSANYTSVVNFQAGMGITLVGSTQNIYSGYQYSGVMIVTNVTSPAISVYNLGNFVTNTVNWAIELGNLGTTVGNIQVSDYYMIFNNPVSITGDVVSPSDVGGKVTYISPSGPVTVNLQTPDTFMGVYTGTSTISTPFIWTSGGTDFYVINQSTTSGANVTLGGLPGSISWTMDPNSNMIIPPGYTGWFMIYLTVSNYPEISSLTAANVYSLGIFTTS